MPSLTTYRRDAASMLGLLDVYTTTAQATGTDAGSSVVCDAFRSSVGQTTFESGYVWPTTGAQSGLQRPVRSNGLSPQTATLKVTWAWPAPLADGDEVEILRLVPAVRELGRPGWREIVNDVLRETPVIRRYPVASTGAHRYAVPVWMETEDQAIGVYAPSSGGPEVISQNLKSIRYDGEVAEIELWSAYSSGASFDLAVYQPYATRIKSAGVWADSSDGLVDDADEAAAPRTLVRALALVRAAELEIARPDPRNKDMWQQALLKWTSIAAALKRRLVPARPTAMSVDAPAASGWPKNLFT